MLRNGATAVAWVSGRSRAQGHDVRPRTYAGDAPCCALTMRPKSFSDPHGGPAAVVTTAPQAACLFRAG